MGKNETPWDFSGYVTKNNLECADGLTIRHNAFAKNDGKIVPLVYQHLHSDPAMILGKVRLENRQDGVYGYGYFNDSKAAGDVKIAMKHGDIDAMSIYANRLVRKHGDVLHGDIKEVSIVLAGANPGAKIDDICFAHSDGTTTEVDDEAIIYTNESIKMYDDSAVSDESVSHADDKPDGADKSAEPKSSDKTVGEVLDTFNQEQKDAMTIVMGEIINRLTKDEQEDKEGGDDDMSHNVFENDAKTGDYISHEEVGVIFADIKRHGSLRESALAHGIENLDYLFSDPKTLSNKPEYIKRPTEWVDVLLSAVHRSPFARIKSVFADITTDDARALGYIKGKKKKEEFFTLIKRSTTPTTVYKKQKIDRDDIVDLDGALDALEIKSEMRMMLDEELARAMIVGDGRPTSSDDKINEQCIRPMWKDDDLFTIRRTLPISSTDTEAAVAKAFIRTAVKSRKTYRGSGRPILFTTEDMLTDCLLLEDANGRTIYDTEEKLATAMRVSKIVTVPIMEGLTRQASTEEGGGTKQLLGLIFNPNDYNVGADKGGQINSFEAFDIDYNAQKFLIETRCSGALTKPYSVIALEKNVTSTPIVPPSDEDEDDVEGV